MYFTKLKRLFSSRERRARSSSASAAPILQTPTSTLPPRPSSSKGPPPITPFPQIQPLQRPASSQGLPSQNIPALQTQHQQRSPPSQDPTLATIPVPNPTVGGVSLANPLPAVQVTSPAPTSQPSAPNSALPLQPLIASKPVAKRYPQFYIQAQNYN